MTQGLRCPRNGKQVDVPASPDTGLDAWEQEMCGWRIETNPAHAILQRQNEGSPRQVSICTLHMPELPMFQRYRLELNQETQMKHPQPSAHHAG